MFFCNGCGEIFEECKIIEEHHPYGIGTVVEKWSVCPHCDYEDITEAKKCNRCGEYFGELHNGLCECCHGDMYGE